MQLSEAFEEGYQGIQTEKGKEVAKMYLDPNYIPRTIESYITDDKIWEQAFWGAVGGMVFQGAGKGLSALQRQIKAKKLKGKKVLLGRIIKNIEQGWSPAPAERNEDGDWDVLTLAAVKYGEFLGDEVKRFSGSVEKCGNLILKKDDFLLTRSNTRDLVGQVCIVDKNMEKTIFSDLIYRLTFNKKYVEPEYLMFYFQTAMMRQQISRDAHGSSSTMVKITHKDIKSWEIELPTLIEQKEYIDKMKRRTEKINKQLEARNQYINLLKEYKKSLIYEYVTGKKEVSESWV